MYYLSSFFILMKCDGTSGMSYDGCKLTVSLKNNNLIEEVANGRLTHKQQQGTHRGTQL